MTRIKKCWCCVVLAGLISSSAQGAHVEVKEALLSLSLQELMELEITSSTLTAKNVKSVPASVSVFTKEQFMRMGADYLHELINFVPGFQSFRQGENSVQHYCSARGHRSSTASREVLILIDGMRMNREFDNVFSVPMLSLHNVEKIEFIRGPGSAIYGSNAFMGVINITTQKNQNRIHTAFGEASQMQFNGAFSNSDSAADAELNLALNLFDEKGEQYVLENYTTLEEETGRDPREGVDFQFNARKGDYQLSGLVSRRDAHDFYNSERTSEIYNKAIHKTSHLQFSRNVNWQSNMRSDFDVGYSENAYEPTIVFPGLGVSVASQKESNWVFNANNHWQYDHHDSLEFGLELRHSNMKAFELQTENLGEFELYPHSKRDIAGLYIQNQRYYNNGLQVVIGGRFDRYSDVGSAFSPRLGFVYPLTDHQTVKALYGEAFRAPTVNELSLQTFSGAVAGNENLEPETIKTWELIWLGIWDHHSLTLNGHYNEIESTIIRDENLPNGNFINQNQGDTFYGVEFDYSFQVSSALLIQANGALLGNLPDADFRQAEHMGAFIINYQYGRWNLNVNSTYAGAREMLVGEERLSIDSYWLLNSKVNYGLNANVSFYLNMKNLLNEAYGTPPQRSIHTVPIPNRGRELVIGGVFEF